jgi:hypothetical protein
MNVSNHEESFGSKTERHLFEMSRREREKIVGIEIFATANSFERST